MYRIKSNGPKMELWGTPVLTKRLLDVSLFNIYVIILFAAC